MAALTAPRSTIREDDHVLPAVRTVPVKAATKCLQGGIAVYDAGYAAPGRTALNLIAAGVFEETADNTGGAAGAVSVRIRRGSFKFANSAGGDLIAQANVGATAYIVDDQTVALTNGTGTRSAAGKIVGVDADGGVWVEIY